MGHCPGGTSYAAGAPHESVGPLLFAPPVAAQRAFVLLELVPVVAATLIVGALALSMLRTHLVRTQIAVSIEESAAARAMVVAAFRAHGAPPSDASAAGIDHSSRKLLLGSNFDHLEVHDGRLDLRFGAAADRAIAGKTLSLTPYETVDREVVWLCGNAPPEAGLMPLGFADGGAQPARAATDIDDRYLPRECR